MKYRAERDELERSGLKQEKLDDDRRGWLKQTDPLLSCPATCGALD